jgi:hypothetical protein
MDQPPAPRRSFWRFSLRELLLLMLAIGAFLGWGRVLYQHYRPYRPTGVVHALNMPAKIDAIRKQIGETDFSYFSSSGGGGGDLRTTDSTGNYVFPLSAANYDAFTERLAAHATSSIESTGCRIVSATRSTAGDDFDMIYVRYRRDVCVGALRLVVMKKDDQRGQVLLFLNEYHQSR